MRTNHRTATVCVLTLATLLLLVTALPATAAPPRTDPSPTCTPTPLTHPLDFFTVVVPTFFRNLVTFATDPDATPLPAPQPTWCCPGTKEPTCPPTEVPKTEVPPTQVPPTGVPPTEVPTAVSPVSVVPTAVLPAAFLPVTGGGDPVGAKLMSLLPVFALLLLALSGLRAARQRS